LLRLKRCHAGDPMVCLAGVRSLTSCHCQFCPIPLDQPLNRTRSLSAIVVTCGTNSSIITLQRPTRSSTTKLLTCNHKWGRAHCRAICE
jgi:hypothetical protein